MRKICIIIMAAALIALPAMAQDWQSTSTLQGTGSNYAPQVTSVGATDANNFATTTESNSPAKAPGGPRRDIVHTEGDFLDGADANESQESPLGDAVLPLMVMAVAMGAVIAFRRKRGMKAAK